ERELGRDDRRVVGLQQRDGHAGVAGGSACVGVVRRLRIAGLFPYTTLFRSGRVVRSIAEAQVRGDRDREQDAEDDDDNEKFDEGETRLLTGQPLPDLAGHYEGSFHRANRVWPHMHRPHHPSWATLGWVIPPRRKGRA